MCVLGAYILSVYLDYMCARSIYLSVYLDYMCARSIYFTVYLDYRCARSIYIYSVSRLYVC